MENVGSITPVRCLLVANRGEIARRVIRTARRMGISTVAIYADGDAVAPFVTEADSAIALNGRSPAETYLNMDKVLAACKRSGADALHPGYGFLSENATFAKAVIDAGLAWIGPSPGVIAAMGDKLSAKKLMDEAGVPTLPAIAIDDTMNLAKAAADIGYPVLVKASAGGGGRGMRVVKEESALQAAVDSAKREAGSAFGDDTVFLEKWLASSRHVEIQIIGDTHGNLVHCFERECSIQRRHQKIIEEAPSPAVNEQLRAAMGTAAINAARKLGYASAGTVEFLLSGKDFWFLEVNARLQVEHPVTEEIIGQDLVREQIRIAEGETLSFNQEDLTINGHAIEARLCAEDPDNDFLPSPGPVTLWAPAGEQRRGERLARFDSGVESGSVISTDFDPMIAKVIVHAPTRREAATRLARVLETTRVQGLTTNRDFLVATLRHPGFLAGDTTTDFIERFDPARKVTIPTDQLVDLAIAIVMESQARHRATARVMKSIPSGWRNTMMPFEIIEFQTDDRRLRLEYRSRRDGRFRVRAATETTTGSDVSTPADTLFEQAGKAPEMIVTPFACGAGHVDLEIDGRRLSFKIDKDGDTWLTHGPSGDLVLQEVPRYPVPGLEDLSGGLVAPMPGSVLAAEVRTGDKVARGDLLFILEAMKMEHRITAPVDGTIAEINVQVGDQVENGQRLVTIDDGEQS